MVACDRFRVTPLHSSLQPDPRHQAACGRGLAARTQARRLPTVRLHSRNGHEWTARLATVTDALQGLACRSAVFDAELCFLTGTGAPNFAGLQLALRSRQHHKLTVFAFDFLHRNGIDLRPLPLYQRKLRLLRLIARSDIPCLHLVETFDDGAKLLDSAERMLLEGIVSKRRNSVYRSGECRDWVKIKTES